MGIKSIVLENWKSYRGNFVIPVYKFSAIIGPNGSGKSNLMDAISFVLGVNSSKLRGKKMVDQINRDDSSIEGKKSKSAFVELVYEQKTENRDELINFKRRISNNGSTTYYLNGKPVKWDDYNQKLKEIGILVKSRNFLVFQGDIESVASMSPKELTNLIEEVSGSSEFDKEYQECLKGKKTAEEELAKHFDRRKGLLKEKKQLLEQKNEAENYKVCLEKLRKTKEDLFVTQYEQYDQKKQEIDTKTLKIGDIQDLKAKRNNALTVVKSSDEVRLQLKSDLNSEEEKSKSLRDSVYSKTSERVLAEEKRNFAYQNLKTIENALDRVKKVKDAHDKRVLKLENELNKAEEAVMIFDREQKESEESNLGILKNKAAKKELNKLENEFAAKSKIDLLNFESLKKVSNEAEEKTKNLEEQISVLSQRKKSVQKSAEESSKLLEELKKSKNSNSSEIAKMKKSFEKSEENSSKSKARKLEIRRKLEEKERSLLALHFDQSLSQRDKKRLDNFNLLKEAFGDCVKGFVVDLLKPIRPKYRVAVMAALGAYNTDAIVVDTSSTAFECVKILKEKRLGTATFFPLNGLKVKPLKEKNRNIDESVKMMVDLVSFREEFRKLAHFVFGSSVYAETLGKAREICFQRKEYRNKLKTITKEGVVIAKNGNMTGGKAANFSKQLKRFDEAEVRNIESQIESLKSEMESIEDMSKYAINEMHDKLQALKKKNGWVKLEISQIDTQNAKDREKMKIIEAEIKSTEKRTKKQRGEKHSAEKGKNEAESVIDTKREKHFAQFSRKYKIKDFKSFSFRLKGFSEELSNRKMEIYQERNTLRDRLEFEKVKKFDDEIVDKEKELETKGDEVKSVNEVITGCNSKINALEDQLKTSTGKISNLKKKLSENSTKARKLENDANKALGKLSAAISAASDIESEAQKILEFKNNIVIRAELDEIDIEELVANKSKKRQKRKEENPGLKTDRLKTQIEQIEKEISEICPNLRSFEHYKKLEEKALKANKEFHGVKARTQKLIQAFVEVEKKKSDSFMKAFNHTEKEINKVYRQMTESKEFPMGGNAYLTLENNDKNPFLHGTVFSAMPPSKRFREIDSLSGGEKSVAALALLFAMHSYRAAPFFILDEVDAALDSSNVKKVVQYVERKTRSEKEFQCLVISLKDTFYHRADELIGVYRDINKNSSGILTMDLGKVAREFGELNGAKEIGSAISEKNKKAALSVSSFDSDSAI